jgi:catechol 2,3-dioxygenase-like lactoylglutathione lyase family enzyme
MSIEINGVAHIQLSVRRFEECRAFYAHGADPDLRLRPDDPFVGGRTGFAFSAADPEQADVAHDPTRSGFHHLCFRARSREDVDQLHLFLRELGAELVRAPEEGPWAPPSIQAWTARRRPPSDRVHRCR